MSLYVLIDIYYILLQYIYVYIYILISFVLLYIATTGWGWFRAGLQLQLGPLAEVQTRWSRSVAKAHVTFITWALVIAL